MDLSEVDSGWLQAVVECDICLTEWVAVYPEGCDRLECPGCGYMTHAPFVDDSDDADGGDDDVNGHALAY